MLADGENGPRISGERIDASVGADRGRRLAATGPGKAGELLIGRGVEEEPRNDSGKAHHRWFAHSLDDRAAAPSPQAFRRHDGAVSGDLGGRRFGAYIKDFNLFG